MAKRGGFPGMGMPGNMNNLMKQAQKMQRQMEEQAKEMQTKEFSATAGGGAVEVKVNGSHEVLAVTLDPEVVDPDDIEMLVANQHQHTNLADITVDQAIRDNIHMDVIIEEDPDEPQE